MKRSRLVQSLKLVFTSLVLLVVSTIAINQAHAAEKNSATISRLKSDLKYLASDELEGRGVGTEGLNKAAEYIRKEFEKAGLDVTRVNKGAFHKFTMDTGAKLGKPNELVIQGPDKKTLTLKFDKDFRTCSFGGSGKFSGGLVFCGYGIDAKNKNYQDFAGIDVRGKVVIIMRRTPGQKNPHGPFGGTQSRIYGSLRAKYQNAFKRGAAAVLFVNDPHTTRAAQARREKAVQDATQKVIQAAERFEQREKTAGKKDPKAIAEARQQLSIALRQLKLARENVTGNTDVLMNFGYGGNPGENRKPIFHISQKVCDQILQAATKKTLAQLEADIDKNLKPQSQLLAGWSARGEANISTIKTEVKNVIAVLEGEGPLADETIVVGAHYDHVGYGKYGSLAPGNHSVHNGADDNASGTVSLLEVARRLAARKKKLPRRIVFIAFTAEELGLIGSARYTANPVFPLKKTIAMFNMDMVGRMRQKKLTVFGVGTAPRWKPLVTRLGGKRFDLALKPEGFGPSDQSSFYAKKIPVLHFFTDTHRDYHRPSDDWEKINYEDMANVVDLVEQVVIETANKKERPKYLEVKQRARVGRARTGSRPYFGVIPSFGSTTKGCAISGTSAGSPAQKAGLKGEDVIVQLGPHKIENLSDFDLALRKYKAGQTVEVIVVRKGKRVKLKVKLAQPR
ncbi:MAG: M28 family peptidase [Planctomycetaceae bacterium]